MCIWGWTRCLGVCERARACRDPGSSAPRLPLLPPGPRKGEELEEEWAPTEKVSE